MAIHSVRLEILRHGPPNNQLLSPLTQYLAISGDHAAATVCVPFEHAEIMRRIDDLRAVGSISQDRRREDLRELGVRMGEILGQVHGLVADLCSCDGDETRIAHLRLVLSAHELALLPFEIAISKAGLPGDGQPLSLQKELPLCITREVRRPQTQSVEWPIHPKVLFVIASPPGLPAVPSEAHLLALRQAVDPWVFAKAVDGREGEGGKADLDPVRDHLDVLVDATVGRLAERMATGDYTHVHILAHGGELPGAHGRHFGVVFHKERNRADTDVVDAERLVAALCPQRASLSGVLRVPTVVTLATCDGGNVGSVVTSAASLAHELHRAGISLVVASQFPLSFVGSIQLVRLLYPRLLAGADPRHVLYEVRSGLRATVPEFHDWAGVVFYARFPPDLDAQLPKVRFERGRQAIHAAIDRLEKVAHSIKPHNADSADGDLVRRAVDRFENARDMLRALMTDADLEAQIHGLLASAEKRVADAYCALKKDSEWRRFAASAAEHYCRCFESDRSRAWALVQKIALGRLLRPGDRMNATSPDEYDEIALARLLSMSDLRAEGDRRVWALNNLIELEVLAPAAEAGKQRNPSLETNVRELLAYRKSHRLDVESLKKQMQRYTKGFLSGVGADKEKAELVFEMLQ